MSITRYENLAIKQIASTVSDIGEQTTTATTWFETRGLVHAVANSLRITDKYRVYSDVVQITVNYSPNMKTVVDDQDHYSISWRGFDWRIAEVRETDDRLKTILICHRNDPTTAI